MSQVPVSPTEARIYTNEFRVYGLVHFRPNTGTAWLMNADDRPHVPMSNVKMYRAGVEHPPRESDLVYDSHFAAIPKESIVWIQGGVNDEAKAGLGLEPREVYLVYPTYVLAGSLDLRPEVRLSDYAGLRMAKKSFVVLNDARVLGHGPVGAHFAELPVLQSHPYVTVDLRKVAAVFDVRGGDPARAYRAED